MNLQQGMQWRRAALLESYGEKTRRVPVEAVQGVSVPGDRLPAFSRVSKRVRQVVTKHRVGWREAVNCKPTNQNRQIKKVSSLC